MSKINQAQYEAELADLAIKKTLEMSGATEGCRVYRFNNRGDIFVIVKAKAPLEHIKFGMRLERKP